MMQVTKVWWDGEKLMAEPIDPATMYEDNEVAQPDSTCNKTLRAEGKGYPRTCRKCGKGPCIADRVQPEQEQWDSVPDAFNEWWNADYDDSGNPYRKDSPAYWAWSGWKAASKQTKQEPVAWSCNRYIEDDNGFQIGTDEPELAWGKYAPDDNGWWPLYTSPLVQRTWVGLTDEERMDVLLALNWDKQLTHMDTAKAIEAKLKEKNT